MKPEQFVNDYNLHDSLIDSIDIQENGQSIRMVLDFAFWMQKGYQESDPETGPLILRFEHVSEYECPAQLPLEEISILKVTLVDEKVVFALLNDCTNEYLEIKIRTENIKAES